MCEKSNALLRIHRKGNSSAKVNLFAHRQTSLDGGMLAENVT
jgi:hypothetical protein